jgi:hypothetical protein
VTREPASASIFLIETDRCGDQSMEPLRWFATWGEAESWLNEHPTPDYYWVIVTELRDDGMRRGVASRPDGRTDQRYNYTRLDGDWEPYPYDFYR